jgi:hypothetical protein
VTTTAAAVSRRLPAARRSGLAFGLIAVAVASAVFYYRQNVAGQIGGPMSVEKVLWLNYAISAWFVLPLALSRHPALHPALRLILGVFVSGMLARGAAELWLLYVTVSWDPMYGITQDIASIALIGVLRRRFRRRLARLDGFDADVRRFTWSLQASLVAEVVFAALFRRMGLHDQAIYFAADSVEFAHINLLTRVVDVAVYGDLARFLWRQRAPLFRHPRAEGCSA